VIPYADGTKTEALVPKKLSGKDELVGSSPMWRPGGRDGQTTEPQLVSALRSKRVSARATRLGLLDLLATTGPCPFPIGQHSEPQLAVTLSHRRSYPDRRPFVLVHYVSLRKRGPPGGSIERFDNSNTILIIIAFPWLRDVPEVISSGTWGQKDPAGSRLASDSAHLPNFSHTTSTPPLNHTRHLRV